MSRLALNVERICRAIYAEAAAAARSRASEKAEARRRRAAWIRAVREAVFALDRACICGGCRPSATDELHEIVPRSKTRGRPLEARFSVENCVRLSRRCHAMVTGEVGAGKRLRLECLDPARGAMGPIRGTYRDGRVFVYERRA